MPRHPKTITLDSFKGLNNVLRPENTPIDYLKKALNVNIDKQGNISKRKGYTKLNSSNYTSIWANNLGTKCYAVKDEDLVEINQDHSSTIIRSNVGIEPISFEEVNNIVYYSSLTHNGIIEEGVSRSWGLDVPNKPNLITTSGSLEAGSYQVSYTYLDFTGKQSGTISASKITVPSNSGISFLIPTPPDPRITSANVYCSTQNGIVLYFNKIGTIGDNVTITNVSGSSNPLRTFNLDSAPNGSIVTYYKGRIYIAFENILWYSEPNQYEFFKMDMNYIEFPDTIHEVMPVEDGIWVGCDNVYYLSGSDPEGFKLSLKERVQVVKGTSKRFSGSYILLDNTPIGYKWLVTTNLGIFVLFNQGVIINLTATNLSLERGSSGTSLFLQDGGMNQYISILQKNNKSNNSVLGDVVTTSVIRNGINIG